ncbi:MAG TPA: beta/gamma crystallin-related protein [Janthinobacterium sp.]|nr:beta/gamma crystallin-related protein [Janthinobacterium sp.]
MIKRALTLARGWTLALLAASVLAPLAAGAGELTLYSQDHFRGREVTLREVSPDLAQLGFNDKASSMVVRSGRWEVCIDADFRGFCAEFGPGEYPLLERFNDRISSAREVGRGNGRMERERERGPRGMVEFFSRPGLEGNSTRIVRDTGDFVQIGFNDRAVSVRIDDGTWQFCSDAEYRGLCRVFGPGTYPDLGPGLAGRVSSARLVH